MIILPFYQIVTLGENQINLFAATVDYMIRWKEMMKLWQIGVSK